MTLALALKWCNRLLIDSCEIGGRPHARLLYVRDNCPCSQWVDISAMSLKELVAWDEANEASRIACLSHPLYVVTK